MLPMRLSAFFLLLITPLFATDFVITDHGAIADGTTLNTAAIQTTSTRPATPVGAGS
ncbi:MAG: hypothetical protein J6386_19010 [Candidatus Synoicihabitans palmerolidicus]|nr:hypothetical protein [Candidatus Synoicihabitans palmerolidicus]